MADQLPSGNERLQIEIDYEAESCGDSLEALAGLLIDLYYRKEKDSAPRPDQDADHPSTIPMEKSRPARSR